jgi:hypothetical protein
MTASERPATTENHMSETMQLRFEGSSDDTFGMTHHSRADDYDNCGSGKPIEWLLTAPNGESMLVVGQYCPGAATGWLIGVARAGDDDDEPMPAWPMRIEHGAREYSPALLIDVPAGTTTRCLQRLIAND